MKAGNHINIMKRTFVLAAGLLLTISVFGYFLSDKNRVILYDLKTNFSEKRLIAINSEAMGRLKEKVIIAKNYVTKNGFDSRYCFLIDMRLPSGKSRFFVYDMLKDSLETAGLVAHGKGSERESGELIFSNTPNSNCTSLGKYKISNSYNGNFGLSYKLIGLDKTNSKAYCRSVVLHSYFGVPKEEVYPASICTSEGCPTVSPEFLTQLKVFMEESKEPILLWIYY
jgi:hypothetical protein